MGSVKKYQALHDRMSAIDMRPSDALEELHSLVCAIYADMRRIHEAINAEITVYDSMIQRAETQAARDKLRLRQAQAGQKKSIDPRMVDSLGNVIAQMREIATECNGGTEISFINDFELPSSDYCSRDCRTQSRGEDKRVGGHVGKDAPRIGAGQTGHDAIHRSREQD